MKVLERFGAIGVAALLVIVACSSSSSSGSARGDGGVGGGNAIGCPSASPKDKTACSLSSGTRCNYGCGAGGPSAATCTGSVWSVSEFAIACQAPDAGGTSSGCHRDADCGASLYCATHEPGGITYCSTRANDTICAVDADCGDSGPGALICESYQCPSGTGRSCFSGCTDAQCGPTEQTGLVCGASRRCEAKACQSPSDCPSNFDCTAGRCQRRSCTADTACQDFCVNGMCAVALGTCELPRG